MSSINPLLLVLWCLWLAIAIQLTLVMRGWLVERREGLRQSRFRLATVSGVFVVATLVTLGVSLMTDTKVSASEPGGTVVTATPSAAPVASPSASQQSQPNEQEIKKLEGKIETLKRQLKETEDQLQTLRSPQAQSPATHEPSGVPSVAPTEIQPEPWITRETLVLIATIAIAILLLVGFLALMIGGPVQTMLPEGWFRASGSSKELTDPQIEVERLATAVWRKDYAKGLDIAEGLTLRQLNTFDRLDALFLQAYCSIQLLVGETAETDLTRRRELLDSAIDLLKNVVDEAPNRGDAVYLLGMAYGMNGEHSEALKNFERAQEILKRQPDLPFAHNLSVCLLHLAQLSLSNNDQKQAEEYFARVTSLGKLAGHVVESRVQIGMNELRNAVNQKDMRSASVAIEKLEGLEELKPELKTQLELIDATFKARVALREGNADQALGHARSFLTRYLPKDLPPVDEEIADETLGSLIDDKDLPFPREVFRGFLFLETVSLCRLESASGRPLSEVQVAKLTEPIFRGLQFDPRQRDLLGALGGLYYWFVREKRQKALEWLEAAALMGVAGKIVYRILERDRLIEMERRDALDWFRSASARFLRDPSLATEVRRALIEELGRFQEFEPLLINLEQRPELEAQVPTLEVIKERAAYLAQVVSNVARKSNQADRQARLTEIRAEYERQLQTLERTLESMDTLERRVIGELGASLAL